MAHIFTPLFNPANQPVRIAALFSGNAGSTQFLIREVSKKPELASKIKVVCALTDKRITRGASALKDLGVPVIELDFKEFCASQNINSKDLQGRKKYFELVLGELAKFEPDILMLSGFMKIITEPLLSAFENKILNVHPANLTIKENGKPKFTGDNAVLDAINAGERDVRSSVHLVSAEVDCGPIIAVSKPERVDTKKVKRLKKSKEKLEEYALELQEKLKRKGDDPAFLKALELIAEGKVAVKKGKVYIEENREWREGYFDLRTGGVKDF